MLDRFFGRVCVANDTSYYVRNVGGGDYRGIVFVLAGDYNPAHARSRAKCKKPRASWGEDTGANG
jgi:hypothetical protein